MNIKEIEALRRKKLIKDKDVLSVGDCIVVIQNKYSGDVRFADGSVSRVPYKTASAEKRKPYGKNLVYVIYRNSERILGYYQ